MIKERIETYRDFTLDLFKTINNYYIDRDTLNNDKDVSNHYNWCFNRICDNFLKEGLSFTNNEKLRNYFYSFYYNQFYFTDEHDGYEKFITFWETIFDLKINKDTNMTKILIELYDIFDISLTVVKEKDCCLVN